MAKLTNYQQLTILSFTNGGREVLFIYHGIETQP
jgi:hypothetical protein